MIFIGEGSVWDARRKGKLCVFNQNGVLDTEDAYVISRLQEMGFTQADTTDVVSVEICNGINVDWRDRHDLLEEKYRALRASYVELQKKLKDIEENTNIPIDAPEPEEAMEEMEEKFILVGDEKLPRDFATSVPMMQLKKFLRKVLTDAPDLRKLTKEQTIREVNKFLVENGYLE